MYTVTYKKKAEKTLKKLPRAVAERFRGAFAALSIGHAEGLDIKPLPGTQGFRLRIGDWRAVYEIDQGVLIIYVFDIGSRGDIYK